jgi:hypothetical protein
VIQYFGMIDKVFSVTLDNASSNSTTMLTLSPMLASVYYPTSPLVIHHILEFSSHLHEHDTNLSVVVVVPMKAKFMKYWKFIPMLYSFSFVLDPRAKMRGLYNVLELLSQSNNYNYITYFAYVKTELYKLYASMKLSLVLLGHPEPHINRI